MGPRSLFIYYKVESALAEQLRERVQSMQRLLRQQHPTLDAQMLMRVDAHPHQTWMEVYQHPDGIGPVLQKAIDQAALAMRADSCGQLGPRHIEVFTPCV